MTVPFMRGMNILCEIIKNRFKIFDYSKVKIALMLFYINFINKFG